MTVAQVIYLHVAIVVGIFIISLIMSKFDFPGRD
jgi:hypothetical protein